MTPLSRLLPLPLGSLSLLHSFVFRPSTLAWSQPLPPIVHGVTFLSSTRCTSDSRLDPSPLSKGDRKLTLSPSPGCLSLALLSFFLSFISVFGTPDPSHCSPFAWTPSQELNLLPHLRPFPAPVSSAVLVLAALQLSSGHHQFHRF